MSNWRTTLAGLGLAILNLYANGMNGKQLAVSAGVLALGTLAKDSNVSNAPNPLAKGQAVTSDNINVVIPK